MYDPPTEHFADLDLGILYDPRYSKRVLSPENAFLMNELMRSVIRTGTGRRALSLGREDLAGKTGTTNNFRDAWFSGFNRDVVTSVWIGFDTPRDLGTRESGARAALPIWIDYMEVALQGKPEKALQIPENIIKAWVHKDTGEAVAVDDPKGLEEFFVMGTEPHAHWYEEARLLFKQMLTGPAQHSRNCSSPSFRNIRRGNQSPVTSPRNPGHTCISRSECWATYLH